MPKYLAILSPDLVISSAPLSFRKRMAFILSSRSISATGLPTRDTDWSISSSSSSETLCGCARGSCPRLARRYEVPDRAVHHKQRRNIVIDGKERLRPAMLIPDINGGGFQYLPVGGPGKISQVILGRGRVFPQQLKHRVGRAVPQLPARNMTVFDVNHRMLQTVARKVVNDDFAARSELRGQSPCHLAQQFQTFFRQYGKPPFSLSS